MPADLCFGQTQLTALENYVLVSFAGVSAAITELNQLMEGFGNCESYKEAAEGWISSAASCNTIQSATSRNTRLDTTFNVPFQFNKNNKKSFSWAMSC